MRRRAISGLIGLTAVLALLLVTPGWAWAGMGHGHFRQTGRARLRSGGRGRGFSFADRLRVTGHEIPPFRSSPRFRARRRVFRGNKLVVPFLGGFFPSYPVAVPSAPSVNVIVNVPSAPPPAPSEPSQPRLCSWIWTAETGKQCLEEAFPGPAASLKQSQAEESDPCPWIWTRETGRRCLEEAFPLTPESRVTPAASRSE